VASKQLAVVRGSQDYKKTFGAGVVTEGRNSSLKIAKLTQSLDFSAGTCRSCCLPVLLVLF